ncbi:MAG TPA: hypothetical protein VM364_06005 [Vicinamibacterales bacterium]|nr:hypothetical protein [Vicinamibacterales bacterium]
MSRLVVMVGLGVLAVLASACAARTTGPTQLPVELFAGHVVRDDSGTWFTPCGAGGSERWWVTFVDAAVSQARTAPASDQLVSGGRSFVRWRASRTDERLVGPGGPALLVRDIIEIRSPGASDCGHAF